MVTKKAASKQDPQIIEMPNQKMAVVYTQGDPNVVGGQALPALYGSAYTLKFALKKQGVEYKVGVLRARWPNLPDTPKDQWIGIWGLPVPDDTATLPQKEPAVEVKLETWEYGTVAQILHLGPYADEPATVERLLAFIAENGYEIAGVHEEEYLTTPKAKVQKAIIRYQVKRK